MKLNGEVEKIAIFFNAEIAEDHAEERRVFGSQSQLILMQKEIILQGNLRKL